MDLKYSVVLATLRSGDTGCDVWEHPRKLLEAIARAGYDGVDMDAEPDLVERSRFHEVRDLAFSLGLKVPALLGAWAPWHAGEERDLCSTDETIRQRAVDYSKRSIDLAATFEEPPLFQLCSCPLHNEYPLASTPHDTLRSRFVRSTREIVEYAVDKKVVIAIEPINKFEGFAGFMNTIPEAISVIDEIGDDHLEIQADFFHMNMADQGFIETLKSMGDRLAHIHLADSNRCLLGTGHFNFPKICRILKEMNFQGYLSLDNVPAKPDWKTMVEQGIQFMKEAERIAADTVPNDCMEKSLS